MKKQTKYLIGGGVFAFVFALTLFLSNNLIGDTYAATVECPSGYNKTFVSNGWYCVGSPVKSAATLTCDSVHGISGSVTESGNGIICSYPGTTYTNSAGCSAVGGDYYADSSGLNKCVFVRNCPSGYSKIKISNTLYHCGKCSYGTLNSAGNCAYYPPQNSGGNQDDGEDEKTSSCTSTKKLYVTPSDGLNVRSGPSTSYSPVGGYGMCAAVNVCSDYYKNGWYKLSSGNYIYGGDGYLSSTAPNSCSSGGSSGSTTAKTYNIYYNANGGSGAPSSQVKTEGKTLTLSSTKPSRTGYTFLGWSTSKTATSATYSAGGSYTSNSSVTLYAVWKGNTIKVVYKPNGGTGTMSDSSFVYGVGMTLDENKFTRTGYTFSSWYVYRDYDGTWRGYNSEEKDGWYPKADIKSYNTYGNKTNISATAPSGTVYFYAKWVANKYTIEYKPGDGGTGTPMENTIVTYGTDTTLRENTYTKENYKFVGWQACRAADNKCFGSDSEQNIGWYSTSEIAEYILYADKSVVNTTTSVNNSIVTLTAIWIGNDEEEDFRMIDKETKDDSDPEIFGTSDDKLGEEIDKDIYIDADDPAIGSNYGKSDISDIKDKTDDELTTNNKTGSAFIIVTIVLAIISLGLCGYYFYRERKKINN